MLFFDISKLIEMLFHYLLFVFITHTQAFLSIHSHFGVYLSEYSHWTRLRVKYTTNVPLFGRDAIEEKEKKREKIYEQHLHDK